MLIYLTDIKQMPKWEKIHASLEDVFVLSTGGLIKDQSFLNKHDKDKAVL